MSDNYDSMKVIELKEKKKKSLWQRFMDWLEVDDEVASPPELPCYPEEFKQEDKKRKKK